MITQERLKELLSYSPITGDFTWLLSTSNRVKVGDIAGAKSSGYIVIRIDGALHMAHRLAWLYVTGEWPSDQIDHLKHDRSDNRFHMLCEASNSSNGKNTSLYKTNTSGITGVSWLADRKKWRSKIQVNGKHKTLGYFTDKFEAICCRMSANNRYGFHINHGRQV